MNQGEQAGIVPAYYDHILGCFWYQDPQGDYIRLADRYLRLRLRQAGFSQARGESEPLSKLESEIVRIQNYQNVSYAAPLAGYQRGVYEIAGKRVLVTTSPRRVEPQPVDWPILRQFLTNLLGGQCEYLYGWLKMALICLSTGKLLAPV